LSFFFQQGRKENIEKETAFSKVCTVLVWNKKKNGVLVLLEILTGKVNTCFLLVFILGWRKKITKLYR